MIILRYSTYTSSLGPRKKRETKNGMIASTSMIFIPSFRNFIFSGEPASLEEITKLYGIITLHTRSPHIG